MLTKSQTDELNEIMAKQRNGIATQADLARKAELIKIDLDSDNLQNELDL